MYRLDLFGHYLYVPSYIHSLSHLSSVVIGSVHTPYLNLRALNEFERINEALHVYAT
jgi:hypothetical protein